MTELKISKGYSLPIIHITNDWLDKATQEELDSILICWAGQGYDLYRTTINKIQEQFNEDKLSISQLIDKWYDSSYPEVNGNSCEAFMTYKNKLYQVKWENIK